MRRARARGADELHRPKGARAAVQGLESDGIRVTGVILNGWNPSSDLYADPPRTQL